MLMPVEDITEQPVTMAQFPFVSYLFLKENLRTKWATRKDCHGQICPGMNVASVAKP